MKNKMVIWAFLITFALTVLVIKFNSNPLEDARQEIHIVSQGETLWDITEEYCPDIMNRNDYIRAIMKYNDIGDYIHAGDKIVVLVVD